MSKKNKTSKQAQPAFIATECEDFYGIHYITTAETRVFVFSDVCTALGLEREEENGATCQPGKEGVTLSLGDEVFDGCIVDTSGHAHYEKLITETGFKSLFLFCENPTALAFKDEVLSDAISLGFEPEPAYLG